MNRIPFIGKIFQNTSTINRVKQQDNVFASATNVGKNKDEVEKSHTKPLEYKQAEVTMKYENEPSHREFRRLEMENEGTKDNANIRNKFEDVISGGGDDVLDEKPRK